MGVARGDTLNTDLRRTAWRIGLQTAGLLLGCLMVVGGVAFFSVVRSQEQQLTESLTAAAGSAVTQRGNDQDRDGDNDLSQPRGGVHTAVLDRGGVRSSVGMPDGLPDPDVMWAVAASGVQDSRIIHLPTGAYSVLTVRRGDDVVQAVASRFEQHQEQERMLGALAVAGGAGLVLSTLAAAVLARRAVRPMAQALELQRRFVADAGHELRTPLTLLSTRAQLLARRVRADGGRPDPERDRLVSRDAEGIVVDTSALTAVLEELLLAADVRTPVPREPVDVRALAATAVGSAAATAEAAGVTLTLQVGDGPVVMAAGAPTALGRSVTALVDNALDHARSTVLVSVAQERRWVVVEVIDDGPGISEKTLPRMFSRFASDRPRAQTGERRHFGLGLALVSEIATRHGGSVTAANRRPPETGAVLRLTLPQG